MTPVVIPTENAVPAPKFKPSPGKPVRVINGKSQHIEFMNRKERRRRGVVVPKKKVDANR